MKIEDLNSVRSLMEILPKFWHPSWNDETLIKALKASDDLAFVFERNGDILGCIFGTDLGFRGYIAGLAVSTHLQGQGVGKGLVKNVENILRKRSTELVISDVVPETEVFYSKLGWEAPRAILLRKNLK